MMWISLLLIACASRAETSAELERLAAENAEQSAKIEALEAEVRAQEARLAALERAGSAAEPSPTSSAAGPCTPGEAADQWIYRPSSSEAGPPDLTEMRLLPHKGPDGELDGYRLSMIRQTSWAASCGLRNGDILHSLNGTPAMRCGRMQSC